MFSPQINAQFTKTHILQRLYDANAVSLGITPETSLNATFESLGIDKEELSALLQRFGERIGKKLTATEDYNPLNINNTVNSLVDHAATLLKADGRLIESGTTAPEMAAKKPASAAVRK